MSRIRSSAAQARHTAPHRTVDTLSRMLEAGTISASMHAAGRRFERAFAHVHRDPLHAPALLRLPNNGGGATDDRAHARQRLDRMLGALGGPDSPAGSCVVNVLGRGMSLREWALRQGWNGRPVRQEEARGILVAALGMLAAEEPPGRRSRSPF